MNNTLNVRSVHFCCFLEHSVLRIHSYFVAGVRSFTWQVAVIIYQDSCFTTHYTLRSNAFRILNTLCMLRVTGVIYEGARLKTHYTLRSNALRFLSIPETYLLSVVT